MAYMGKKVLLYLATLSSTQATSVSEWPLLLSLFKLQLLGREGED